MKPGNLLYKVLNPTVSILKDEYKRNLLKLEFILELFIIFRNKNAYFSHRLSVSLQNINSETSYLK